MQGKSQSSVSVFNGPDSNETFLRNFSFEYEQLKTLTDNCDTTDTPYTPVVHFSLQSFRFPTPFGTMTKLDNYSVLLRTTHVTRRVFFLPYSNNSKFFA